MPPFVRKRGVRGPSDVAGRLRNAYRSCPGGSLRAIRPRFGIPGNAKGRPRAGPISHAKNGYRAFCKNFRKPDPPRADCPVGIPSCAGSVSRRTARSFEECRKPAFPRAAETVRTGRFMPYAGIGPLFPRAPETLAARFFRRKDATFRGSNERRAPERTGVSPYYFSKSAVRSISSNVIGRISQSPMPRISTKATERASFFLSCFSAAIRRGNSMPVVTGSPIRSNTLRTRAASSVVTVPSLSDRRAIVTVPIATASPCRKSRLHFSIACANVCPRLSLRRSPLSRSSR